MNLPPLPELPSSPESRLRWIAWGEEVARMERERCAMIAAIHSNYPVECAWDEGYAAGRHSAAAAIRGEAERKDER